jgi:hypothetical protein
MPGVVPERVALREHCRRHDLAFSEREAVEALHERVGISIQRITSRDVRSARVL